MRANCCTRMDQEIASGNVCPWDNKIYGTPYVPDDCDCIEIPEIEINYCPFCGRKLKEKEDE